MEIRKCTSQDLQNVVAIMNQAIAVKTNAYLKPFIGMEAQHWFEQLLMHSEHVIVAEDSSEIIGWASLSPYRNGRGALASVSEITFYVHNNHHRKGVASMMVEFLESTSIMSGKIHLMAVLLDDNQASKSLLEKHQFIVWGHLPDIATFGEERKGQFYMGKSLAASF